ncbi:MAG: hypothetical protein UT40_C0040G0004 [Candidatus Woesebacteria bacterium GW2011_GWA1_39_21b]|uniref:Glycosyltransferase 2-like domain-containing protein n=1 Tax=Candidatus Woesebacteria bacterium GW2011_GWA1_39_21b TaxID=1618551 RepID=A0A0G0NEE0_9BACT|nr:MAG: hypothetical protein US72_C0006G0038 [Microgenomates group bacterium GW2011_GWC1_38_12]KKR11156.1 MAG: hypothetical protein UT40_C0040G0004 [Candidatus Woesebacteria bacterium GW2011_GWA1_39_21b]
MKLSIIIPVYNEERTVAEIINRVKKVGFPANISREVIVVNDASIDKTDKILKKIDGIKIYTHETNQGKGAAVMTGLKYSEGDVVVIQDADLEYNPEDIIHLIAPILDNKGEVVYGSRLKNYPLRLSGKRKTPLITHYLGNKLLSFITSFLYGNYLSDMETGHKAFKKSVIAGMEIHSKRFDFEPEFTAKILKTGHRILEIPVKVKPRGYDEGKKITWKDGFYALWTLIKYRFVD